MCTIAVLPSPFNTMSRCIRRSSHSTKVKDSGKSWSTTAAICGSASRSETRAKVRSRQVARNSMTVVCRIWSDKFCEASASKNASFIANIRNDGTSIARICDSRGSLLRVNSICTKC